MKIKTSARLAACVLLPITVSAQHPAWAQTDDSAPAGVTAPQEDSPPPSQEAAPAPAESAGDPQAPVAPGEAEPVPAAPPPTPSGTNDDEKVHAVSTGLTVVGQRKRREKRTSAHTLGEAELERLNQDDPHGVLNKVPGVYTRQEDGIGLRPNIGIRGVNPDRSKKITLLEDDVLFGPAPYSAPAAYFFPLVTRMTEVDVIKGAASLTQGPQTVAGAINFRTREIPQELSGAVDVAAGQYLYGKAHAHVGGTWNRFGFLLEGVHLRTNGFKQLDGGGNTGFDRNEWMLKARYVFNPGADTTHAVRMKLGYSDENSNETYLGLATSDFRAAPLRRYAASALDQMKWDRAQADLRYEIRHQNFDLTTTAYRHDLARIWRKVNGFDRNAPSIIDVLRDPTAESNRSYYDALRNVDLTGLGTQRILIGPNDRDFTSQGVQSRGHWRSQVAGFRNELEFFARVHHDRAARVHTQDPYTFVNGDLTLLPGMTERTADDVMRTLALSFYVADELELGKLTVKPGVRMEIVRSRFQPRLGGTETAFTNRDMALLPGLNLHHQLLRSLAIVGGVYRGYSPPSPRDRAAQSERSVNFDGGIRYESGRYRAELIGFWNAYQNLTAECPDVACRDEAVGLQTNAGRARIRGIEAFAQTEFRKGATSVPIMLGYTFTDAKFLQGFTSNDPIFGTVVPGDRIPYVPRHQLSLTVALERPRWGVNASGTHVGRMYDVPPSQLAARQTDQLTMIDVGAHLNLPYNAQLYLQVRNLFDEAAIVSYRPFGARPNAPRWIQVGGRWSF